MLLLLLASDSVPLVLDVAVGKGAHDLVRFLARHIYEHLIQLGFWALLSRQLPEFNLLLVQPIHRSALRLKIDREAPGVGGAELDGH